MQSTPILVLDENVNINSVFLDSVGNTILIGTSDGRIIKMNQFVTNAYLTGERSIFAQLQDGFGNVSDIGYSSLTYQLKEQIVKILEDKTLELLKETIISFSASMLENKADAIFTSQVLNGGEDFIAWTSMEWKQTTPTNTSTRIYARSANSVGGIVSSKWYCLKYTDNAGSIFLSLDDLDSVGQYIQFKIVLTTSAINITPSVYDLNVFYKTITASLFFTQKYILKKETNARSIILTANIIKPQYTEIKFGISDGKTTDWGDYLPIDIEKLTEIQSAIKDRIKVGIKLISHTPSSYPIVGEFALIFKGNKENLLNK